MLLCTRVLCPNVVPFSPHWTGRRTVELHDASHFWHSPPNSASVATSHGTNHQLYEGKLPQTDWWRKSVLMRVGHYNTISPTRHNYACHPESLCGVTWNQLTSTITERILEVGLGGQCPTSWALTTQSDSRVLLSLDNSGPPEPLPHRTRSLRCL